MTDEALALAFRSGLPFVGLRDHTPDPDLDRVVPPEAARSARALPVAAKDDHIRLAVAHPDPDLSALAPYLAGREIDLALAPREELDAILGPPPPVAEPEQAPEQLAEEAAEPERLEPEPEPLTAEPTTPPDTPQPEPLPAEPTTPPDTPQPEPLDDHPELAGELPSWLEPPRRAGRVVLTVVIVIVLLAVAAAILIAVANA